MDLYAMRYAGFAISPFHGNVQFDRHPTEGVGWVFGAKGVQSTLSEEAVEDARGAASAISGGGLFGMDVTGGLFGMSGGLGGEDRLGSNHQDSREGLRCRLMR